jgi:hypothetical protein
MEYDYCSRYRVGGGVGVGSLRVLCRGEDSKRGKEESKAHRRESLGADNALYVRLKRLDHPLRSLVVGHGLVQGSSSKG